MRKTDEKRSKRQFFRLSRLIIQPPGGELKNPRVKSCVLVQTPCLPSFVKIFHHLGQLFERKLMNFCYLVGAFTLFFFITNWAQKGNHLRWLINFNVTSANTSKAQSPDVKGWSTAENKFIPRGPKDRPHLKRAPIIRVRKEHYKKYLPRNPKHRIQLNESTAQK